MEAIAKNKSIATSINVSRRQLLLNHESAAIREQATKIFGGATRPDRAAVMKDYALGRQSGKWACRLW